MASPLDRMHAAADLMVARGLTVKESSGWETRGRPYSFNPTTGLICHHTAATTDIDSVLINGRSDLPGPLCHYALHKNGDVVLIAAGYANHAGESLPGAPTNSSGWGIEATGPIPLDGYGPGAFPNYEAYQVMVGCMLDADGWNTDRVWFHKTSCSPPGRKIDPSFDFDQFVSGIGSGGTEADLTGDESKWLKAIYDAMVVPGSTDPSYPYEQNYNRVKQLVAALNVPGTTSAEHAQNVLFARVRNLEGTVGQMAQQMGIPFTPTDTTPP